MSYFPAVGNTTPGQAVGSGGSGPPPPASPIELDSLRLWLRADDYVTTSYQHGAGFMNGWGSKAKDYPLALTRNGVGDPVVVTSAVNGHTAIDFKNKGQMIVPFNDAYTRNMIEYTFIVVAKFTSAVRNVNAMIARLTGNEFIFSIHAGAQKMALAYTNTSGILKEAFSANPVTATDWNIYTVTAKTNVSFYINGTANGVTAVDGSLGHVEAISERLYVGGNPNNSINTSDFIAEAIVYNKELTAEQLEPIFDELKERYAID